MTSFGDGSYTFNAGIADQVRDQMASVTMKLKNDLDNMDSQVRANLAEWIDGAAETYEQAKVQWDAAAARMPHSLNAAEVALQEISGGYLKIEHTGMNAWGGYSVK